MNIKKTNAARLLDELNISYTLHSFTPGEDLSAVAAAASLGVDSDLVFKTLVTRGDKNGINLVCIPAAAELDFKKLAQATGNKSIEMVPLKEVNQLTGYIRGGCSPLATKKVYPVTIEEIAQLYERIYVSAGQRGLNMDIAPDDLARATNAQFAAICRE